MDPKYLILGGGAAAVMALGYLGLNYSEENDEEMEKVFDKSETTVSKQKNLVKKEVEEELKNKKVNINLEVNEKNNEEVNEEEEISKEVTGWGQFWKEQYKDNTNNIANEANAADFN